MNVYNCKVFFEDTDTAQIVYHANYLKFCDRARTEWMQTLGVSFSEWLENERSTFVVADITMKFHRPARLGDELEVHSTIAAVGFVEITFDQSVRCASSQQRLCDVTVRCAFVKGTALKLTKMPREIRARFANEVTQA